MLEAGRVVASGPSAELAESDAVRRAYFGDLAELADHDGGGPMTELVTYLVSGIALGSSFALIGSGFVVVHRVTRVVNFAQGSIAVVGGDAVGLAAGRPAAARAGRAGGRPDLRRGRSAGGVLAIGRRGTPR